MFETEPVLSMLTQIEDSIEAIWLCRHELMPLSETIKRMIADLD